MTRANRLTWMPIMIVTAALLAVLAFLYARSAQHGESDYLENVTLLRHLKQLDAQWELDVLKSKIGINMSYDLLADSQIELSALLDRSESDLAAQMHDKSDALAKGGAALRWVVQEKANLIERFKSHNSLLHNSLAFLPTAAQDVQQSIGEGLAQERATARVDDLLLASLLYSQNASDERRVEIRAALSTLNERSRLLPSPVQDRLTTFGLHVDTILREQQVVNELLESITAVPTAARIDDVNNILSAEQHRVSAQNQRSREYLLLFSAALIGLFLYAATRLVRSHAVIKDSRDKLLEYGRGLEAMVADRVAALRESESRMTQLAQYDSLTGLPNRSLFRDRLAHAMSRADRDKHHMALMFVDLDHFKEINDSLGHAVGDEVLKAVSQRLRESLREVDTIARLGGDEFTVILEGLGEPDDAAQVATKITQAFGKPLNLGGRDFVVSASIGIALYPFGSNDGDGLLQAADIAMYRAKESGRNAHATFAPAMAVQINERVSMGAQLRHALERDEFEIHYQPKLDLASGSIVGVEALLRWNSKQLGSVSPARFIPLAEEMGLIVPIGEWVLRTACAQGMAWQRQGLPPLSIAVNLSPRQLREPMLIQRISEALRDSGLPAAQLELELTEGVIMEDVKGNIDTLLAIRELGASLAVDDFGTGYSSLAYLARLPIQTLKIDRAFVASMMEDANSKTLVSTMVTLAHSLNLKVVAEGVETLGQQRLLNRLHCDQIQGYYLSRPLPAQALEALVRSRMTPAAALRGRSAELSLVMACG